jgi:hypothetical protein
LAKDWKIELIKAHTRLFHPLKEHLEGVQGYPECNEGWRDLIERACVRIENALDNGDTVKIVQIKEKYGTLRFYWRGRLPSETEAKVGEVVSLAEARSACTCETCGAEGRLYNRGGWFATACSASQAGIRKPSDSSQVRRRRTPEGVLPPLRPCDGRLCGRRPRLSRNRGGMTWCPSSGTGGLPSCRHTSNFSI